MIIKNVNISVGDWRKLVRYILFSKNEPLLEFDLKGSLVEKVNIVGNVALLPEILTTGKEAALQHWLSTRGIDTTRTNARLLLQELHMNYLENALAWIDEA